VAVQPDNTAPTAITITDCSINLHVRASI